jgi:myo-inositol-1(or 4)-monophosphatase
MRIEDVVRVAKKSGVALRDAFGNKRLSRVIGQGRSGDITRLADKVAEDIAIAEIRKLGNCEVISEEAGALVFGEPKVRWFLDPLDGSANFARSIPIFAVSILIESVPKKEPMLAVVYDPIGDKCFTAEAGKGAFMNGKPIRTRKRERLKDCLFDLDLHLGQAKEKIARFVSAIERIGSHIRTFRSIGSCAIALCLSASGQLDGFLDLTGSSRIVDIAAGILILEEAGGVATDLAGSKIREGYDSVIACSSKKINQEIRLLLQRG